MNELYGIEGNVWTLEYTNPIKGYEHSENTMHASTVTDYIQFIAHTT